MINLAKNMINRGRGHRLHNIVVSLTLRALRAFPEGATAFPNGNVKESAERPQPFSAGIPCCCITELFVALVRFRADSAA